MAKAIPISGSSAKTPAPMRRNGETAAEHEAKPRKETAVMNTLMKMAMVLVPLAAMTLSTAPASAKSRCISHDGAVKQLAKKYKESVVGRGLAKGSKSMMELFVSKKGHLDPRRDQHQGRQLRRGCRRELVRRPGHKGGCRRTVLIRPKGRPTRKNSYSPRAPSPVAPSAAGLFLSSDPFTTACRIHRSGPSPSNCPRWAHQLGTQRDRVRIWTLDWLERQRL